MHNSYYPEMKQPKPEGDIEASLCHFGKHWFLKTKLELKGQGIKDRGKIKEGETCGPRAAGLVGMNQYYVTEKAFKKICEQHSVVSEMLL